MRISIITLFPQNFETILNSSILKAAQIKKRVFFEVIDLREFGEGPHKSVDDRVYGGGVGMVLKADILAKAVKKVTGYSKQGTAKKLKPVNYNLKTILMSASGAPYKQSSAQELSKLDHLVIVCGHYEGIDQRFIENYVDEEISIGDYILTGGEIPAMVIIDSVVRLLPGVLKEEATLNESFSNPTLLEYPQYTRPEEFEGKKVPGVLLSGNHGEIAKWREEKSIEKTKKVRPDLT